MRDCKFFSLRELNEAVAEKLKELNNRPFKQMAGCRRNAYLEEEKPYMLPLPASAYEPLSGRLPKSPTTTLLRTAGTSILFPTT